MSLVQRFTQQRNCWLRTLKCTDGCSGSANSKAASAAILILTAAVAYNNVNKSGSLKPDEVKFTVKPPLDYKLEEIDGSESTASDPPNLKAFVGMSQINANENIEDRLLAGDLRVGKQKAVLCAAIDGHGGPRVAATVHKNLLKYVQSEIDQLGIKSVSEINKLETALNNAFIILDTDLYKQTQISLAGMPKWTRWKCGACNLAAIVTQNHCVVANAGDCEGVISYPHMSKKFVRVNQPHSANELSERQRLIKEHPNESDVVKCKRMVQRDVEAVTWIDKIKRCLHLGSRTEEVPSSCYVKGRLMPTKSFGDFHLKFEECANDKENKKLLVSPPYSFPYISATPDLYKTKISRWVPSYLAIGTDGVFDFLDHSDIHVILREAHYNRCTPQHMAKRLVHGTVSRAASLRNRSVHELLNASTAGKFRRRLYDDTSVCVVDLKKIQKHLRKNK